MLIQEIPLDQIQPYGNNCRVNDNAVKSVCKSLQEFGWQQPIVTDKDLIIIVGHTRLKAAQKLGYKTAPVKIEKDLSPEKVRMYRLADNNIKSEWDFNKLDFECESLNKIFDFKAFDFDPWGKEEEEIKEVEGEDDIPEVKESVCKLGDLWELGKHRLLCGDSTKAEDVERLMGGKKSILIHADPPYGMGKEKDGVLNDNLHREKLDKFQMDWWITFRNYLEDNASAYIWGNAEALWRLWYKGGLMESERLTFRNEIVWDKQGEGNPTLRVCGATFETDRSFTQSERCFFFMLGEQGFNNNSDNYWEGWDPIRLYLEKEMKKCGWTVSDLNKITKTQMAAHWVTKSQWGLITEDYYKIIQTAAKDHGAFKEKHDEFKKKFYKTRPYFDSTHDTMTDVWQYERVKGSDRCGHATPKPVEMICRIINSSSEKGKVVVEPFLGSGSTLIACEKTGRKCYGMEIDPHYCDVIIVRWQTFTGKKARKI